MPVLFLCLCGRGKVVQKTGTMEQIGAERGEMHGESERLGQDRQ